MARYRYNTGRYRGGRGVPPWLIVILVIAAVALLASLAFRSLPPPQREEEPKQAVPALAAASLPEPAAAPEPAPAPELTPPPRVRGVYVSGPTAGGGNMQGLIDLLDATELNAMVIDVKNDEGLVTYVPEAGTAVALNACAGYIRDLSGLVSTLKDHGIYAIARVVAFKDPVLAAARPELVLRYADGSPISEGGQAAWINPYEQGSWDYLTEIALGAARAGFDEVQLDYVRFPTVRDIGSVDFGPAAGAAGREQIIARFLAHVRDALHKEGVWLSADVFGTVIGSELDAGLIGQSYTDMAREADFICPMVYPSHYSSGAFGLSIPDREPYQTVRAALDRSQAVLAGLDDEDLPGVRAWLQGFTAAWVRGHAVYGGEELRAQIQAVYDAGYTDWIIWNAGNTYSADGLLPEDAAEQSNDTEGLP